MEPIQVKLIPREIREASFPIARFISSEEEAKYKEALKQYSGKARDNLNVESNIWKILLLNQIGIRTATLPELESALENGLSLSGHCEDAREVVLRTAEDSYPQNDYLAKSLTEQLKIKQFRSPLVVKGLEVVEDKKSDYGLAFKVNDKTEVIEALDFAHANDLRKFIRINPDYSVEFNDKGNRVLRTRPDGLSRACLDRDLDLYSWYMHLADSGSDGRVVVVAA